MHEADKEAFIPEKTEKLRHFLFDEKIKSRLEFLLERKRLVDLVKDGVRPDAIDNESPLSDGDRKIYLDIIHSLALEQDKNFPKEDCFDRANELRKELCGANTIENLDKAVVSLANDAENDADELAAIKIATRIRRRELAQEKKIEVEDKWSLKLWTSFKEFVGSGDKDRAGEFAEKKIKNLVVEGFNIEKIKKNSDLLKNLFLAGFVVGELIEEINERDMDDDGIPKKIDKIDQKLDELKKVADSKITNIPESMNIHDQLQAQAQALRAKWQESITSGFGERTSLLDPTEYKRFYANLDNLNTLFKQYRTDEGLMAVMGNLSEAQKSEIDGLVAELKKGEGFTRHNDNIPENDRKRLKALYDRLMFEVSIVNGESTDQADLIFTERVKDWLIWTTDGDYSQIESFWNLYQASNLFVLEDDVDEMRRMGERFQVRKKDLEKMDRNTGSKDIEHHNRMNAMQILLNQLGKMIEAVESGEGKENREVLTEQEAFLEVLDIHNQIKNTKQKTKEIEGIYKELWVKYKTELREQLSEADRLLCDFMFANQDMIIDQDPPKGDYTISNFSPDKLDNARTFNYDRATSIRGFEYHPEYGKKVRLILDKIDYLLIHGDRNSNKFHVASLNASTEGLISSEVQKLLNAEGYEIVPIKDYISSEDEVAKLKQIPDIILEQSVLFDQTSGKRDELFLDISPGAVTKIFGGQDETQYWKPGAIISYDIFRYGRKPGPLFYMLTAVCLSKEGLVDNVGTLGINPEDASFAGTLKQKKDFLEGEYIHRVREILPVICEKEQISTIVEKAIEMSTDVVNNGAAFIEQNGKYVFRPWGATFPPFSQSMRAHKKDLDGAGNLKDDLSYESRDYVIALRGWMGLVDMLKEKPKKLDIDGASRHVDKVHKYIGMAKIIPGEHLNALNLILFLEYFKAFKYLSPRNSLNYDALKVEVLRKVDDSIPTSAGGLPNHVKSFATYLLKDTDDFLMPWHPVLNELIEYETEEKTRDWDKSKFTTKAQVKILKAEIAAKEKQKNPKKRDVPEWTIKWDLPSSTKVS